MLTKLPLMLSRTLRLMLPLTHTLMPGSSLLVASLMMLDLHGRLPLLPRELKVVRAVRLPRRPSPRRKRRRLRMMMNSIFSVMMMRRLLRPLLRPPLKPRRVPRKPRRLLLRNLLSSGKSNHGVRRPTSMTWPLRFLRSQWTVSFGRLNTKRNLLLTVCTSLLSEPPLRMLRSPLMTFKKKSKLWKTTFSLSISSLLTRSDRVWIF
mmetsp:Transcript_35574/g.25977  ORF Transcript_35574/g.25977 Transcript_35574/m.25977 type:complete len:206 (-) Transcript_35574:56-673(-)